jgi:hypothetical protein
MIHFPLTADSVGNYSDDYDDETYADGEERCEAAI